MQVLSHLISLELGGSNSGKNLWPQAGFTVPWNYHGKDRLDYALHYLVCHGELSLETAQRAIAKNWIEAFKAVCGDPARWMCSVPIRVTLSKNIPPLPGGQTETIGAWPRYPTIPCLRHANRPSEPGWLVP